MSEHEPDRARADENPTSPADTNQPVQDIPLCVDLDGTLARTDFLFESFFILLRIDPWVLLRLPIWLLKGKAYLKAKIASRVDMVGTHYPINETVADYIREQRPRRQTVLVTGSHQSIAEAVAEKTGLFDVVQGSDEQRNLTSTRKRAWLEERYGKDGFDYIGNDNDDLNVWPAARNALVVSRPNGIAQRAGIEFSKVFELPAIHWRDIASLLRVHQWSKNALIMVPFFLDHRFGDMAALMSILLAFLAMSLLASMTYIFNDLLDLQADRLNRTKAKRSLPSGRIPIAWGLAAMVILASLVMVVMIFLPMGFNLALLAYLVLTVTYSMVLKQRAIIDVGMIAALHTLRVIAGTLAIQAEWSFWLLAFSMFIFFSLAMAKRVAELLNLEASGRKSTVGRAYQVSDLPVLMASGVSTGYLSVLIVALYINSDKVLTNYAVPEILWFVCPVLMYWVGRLWMITARGLMHEDPIVFALRDRVSRLTVGVLAVLVGLAIVL